jgi:predicted DNA-binding transcriptional regulator YafY
VTASVLVTEAAMIQFAKNYAPDVVILEPQRMVDEMKDWAKSVKKLYG